jgi:hypothetical protein
MAVATMAVITKFPHTIVVNKLHTVRRDLVQSSSGIVENSTWLQNTSYTLHLGPLQHYYVAAWQALKS